MSDQDWRPSASLQVLKQRAQLLADIRAYFAQQKVMEVETPILSVAGGTDVQLESWQTQDGRSLHTSPEFAMKRLLAAGSGDIFQICRTFRRDEQGQRHQPEFTMLEWYRVGFHESELMADITRLIRTLSGRTDLPTRTLSYTEAFQMAGLPDPHQSSLAALRAVVFRHLQAQAGTWSRDDCLEALMAMVVEPSLPAEMLVYVHSFPYTQAALAEHQVVDGVKVARRFELFWGGMELANGYFELCDAQEQARRFAEDCRTREANGQSVPVQDERFLAALQQGMPACSGVALGLDRLMMVLLGKAHINEVIAFPFDRS